MAANALVDIGFRTRLATLSVATTGTITLAATAVGYTRPSGSFIADGFQVGQEVTPVGFTVLTPQLITGVAALSLTVRGAMTAEASAGSRSLTVGLPAFRVYSNNDFTPTTNRHYVEMEVVPSSPTQLSFPAQGGTREDQGVYVVRWYGVANMGALGLRSCADKLLALFTPGTTMVLSDSSVVHIRGDSGSYASALMNGPPGFAVIVLTIPWRRYASNAVV